MATELHRLSAAELGGAYRERRLSPVEVVEAVLARIEALEPRLGAMYRIDREGARVCARASEARWQKREPLSALDGVPITIKDNIATKGDPTPMGTAANADAPPARTDSPPACRVREAGCIILGKTTMPDFGMLVSGVSSLHGVTRNPWNLERNPGGSSSGAGAAVAAGYGPLALGTDIGGSVRLPAAYCGIVALKPSLGRVPIHPPYWGRVTGPMTRIVTDAALLMDVLKRPDHHDFMALPPDPAEYAAGLDGPVRGLKLGLVLDIGAGTPAADEVKAAVEAAARRLAAEGAEVTPVGPIVTPDLMRGIDVFFRARSFTEFLKLSPARQARILPFVHEWAQAAAGWSAVELFRALNAIFELRERCVRATQPFDYLLMPTSPIPAYDADEPCPGSDPAHPFDHLVFAAPFNQSEQPAASINCGFTADGLPIGLQIVGHRFDDLGVLRLARAWERLRPEMPAFPPL